MAENKTISLTPDAKIVFDQLAHELPGMSFSGSLKEVAEHYLRCKTHGKYVPSFFDSITLWEKFIRKQEQSDLRNLQERLKQLDNLFRMRAMKWL